MARSMIGCARLGASLALAAAAGGGACSSDPRTPLAWGIGVHKLDARALGLVSGAVAADPFADAIADTPTLMIPTYDGSGQATHPDVLRRDPGEPLLMAMTPYPFSDDRIENPSLLMSKDGMAFEGLPMLVNPLVPPPHLDHESDHNDDPDLRWDPVHQEYELVYLETQAPDHQSVVALRSPDLVAWTRSDAIVYDLAHGADFIVSPAVVHDGATTRMFYVNLSAPSFAQRLEVMTSADGRTWDPANKRRVAIDMGGVTPWHIDVVTGPAGYAMLISGYVGDFGHQDLYVATSPDLETWTLRPEPLLAYSDPALGVESLYRSSGLVAGGALIVWYSMKLRL